MKIIISQTPLLLGERAAADAAEYLKNVIAQKGSARIVVSTGSSQFETLDALTKTDVDFSKVEMFHLDEYVGLPVTHIASFRKYLMERLISKVNFLSYTLVDGTVEGIPALSAKLCEKEVDLGIIGIGENGHIAFNDPPADFDTKEAYIAVNLNDTCKRQQVGEGWFATVDDVPKQAISMTPYRIMQCKKIISAVPHKVKAWAVNAAINDEISNKVPATLLRTHSDWTLYIDDASASMLPNEQKEQWLVK